MTPAARVLVLDIGKTNAKAALVDAATLAEIEVVTAPNRTRPGPPYPHADVDALWRFLCDAARRLAPRGIDAVVVTTHGATAALLDAEGGLALPVLDYEHDGPDELAADYARARPAFAETGSPPLPMGLNLGAQLFWQFRRFPREAARVARIVTWPQYWAFRLCGVEVVEPTSLGCHTDLWEPKAGRFSSLVHAEGWERLMPPVRGASDRLGTLTPEAAAATGLDPATPVFCGIHDSNASLLPHLVARPAPFAVVSTGTWVVSMAVGGRAVTLDPARDTLINVDAFGGAVPSARFMGGRERERLMAGDDTSGSETDAAAVLAAGTMLLPAVETGSGPFSGRRHRWCGGEPGESGRRAVAVSWYLALMTDVCLEMIGAEGPVVVEGPFGGNAQFMAMLEAACGRTVIAASGTGTSAGAALLTRPGLAPGGAGPATTPPSRPPGERLQALAAYAGAWRTAVGVGPSR